MLVSVRHYSRVCSGGRQAELPLALMSREPAVSVIHFKSGSDVGHDLLDRATGCVQEGVNHNLSFPGRRILPEIPHTRVSCTFSTDCIGAAALQSDHRIR